ncbi:MAG: hypothetical protein O2888_02020 [Chloroflexi bacterium]|nr:hypothetical protein [Chloroflexota bacterium]
MARLNVRRGEGRSSTIATEESTSKADAGLEDAAVTDAKVTEAAGAPPRRRFRLPRTFD